MARKDVWFSNTKTGTAFLGFATVGSSGELVTIQNSGIELTKGSLESSRDSIIDLIFTEYEHRYGKELGWNEKQLVYSWDLQGNSRYRKLKGGIIITRESLDVLPSALTLFPRETGTCTIIGAASSYSAISEDPAVATASVNGDKLTIEGHSIGSTSITVKDAASHSENVSVTVFDGTWTDPVTGMEFIWVEGFCYDMGCGAWAGNCARKELPVHEVCLQNFWIGKYEVTQGQWEQIMSEDPSRYNDGDNYPVNMVSWDECQEFIHALSHLSGRPFRLPTEAEWEYAARSQGRQQKYAGGDNLDSLGWYAGNSGVRIHEVGTKACNGLGVYDMSGNIWEWCQDIWHEDYYGAPTDGSAWTTGGDSHWRMLRGGSYHNDPWLCRTACRTMLRPYMKSREAGFRLVISAGE